MRHGSGHSLVVTTRVLVLPRCTSSLEEDTTGNSPVDKDSLLEILSPSTRNSPVAEGESKDLESPVFRNSPWRKQDFCKIGTSEALPHGWRLATEAEAKGSPDKVKDVLGAGDFAKLAAGVKIGHDLEIAALDDEEVVENQLICLDWKMVLRAQVHTVNYLSLYLPVSPCVWITKKLKIRFILLYLKLRSKWSTLIIIASSLFCTLVMPCAFARTFIRYDCGQHPIQLTEATVSCNVGRACPNLDELAGKLKRTDCGVEDFLRDWKLMLLPGGAMLIFMISSWHMLHWRRLRPLEIYIAFVVKRLIPKVYMSGLGPSGTRDAGRAFMARAGPQYTNEYSWFHDLFGAAQRAQYIVLLCAALCLGFTTTGVAVAHTNSSDRVHTVEGMVGVLLGGGIGALAGFTISRFLLLVMNEILGADESLISAIVSTLKSHQPHRHVTQGATNEIDLEKIAGAVESAFDMVRGWKVEGGEELAETIRKEGGNLLVVIAKRLVGKYAHELNTSCGPCFQLFKTAWHFACAEHELIALSLLDMPLFLVDFYDPNWEVRALINESTGAYSWTRFLRLRSVIITHPDVKICTQAQNSQGTWEIEVLEVDRLRSSKSFARYGGYFRPSKPGPGLYKAACSPQFRCQPWTNNSD